MVVAAPALNFQPKQATLPVKGFLQRLLLVTERYAEDIIRAYAGEGLRTLVRQKLVIAEAEDEHALLQLERTHQLLNRDLFLQGSTSKANYLYVNSQIVLERLETKLRNKLVLDCQPLSELTVK